MIYVVLGIFLLTYALLIFRSIRGKVVLPVWASMAVGALLMVVTFSISPIEAFNSIDFQIIAFLFGILVITAGFEKSGLIEFMVLTVLRRAKSIDNLLIGIIFGAGLLSALLVNDAIALLLTPLVINISSKIGMKNPRGLLMPLAFGITTGCAFTPIGNPQNLLVALNSGMSRPFTQFIAFLLVPSVLSLLTVYLLSKIFFRRDLKPAQGLERNKDELSFSPSHSSTSSSSSPTLSAPSDAITDVGLAKLSGTITILLVGTFAVVEVFPGLQAFGLSLSNIALAYGAILLILSPRRLYLLVGLNWGILIFFAGMFVVMRAVWDSNMGSTLLSILPTPNPASRVQSTGAIMLNSVLLSQILSNVPMVQLYTYEMNALGFSATSTIAWLSLAAGSTLAGNLTLLGAVSNVIIVDSADAKRSKAFTFLEFLKYGSLVTLVTALIFFAFLAFV